MKTFVAFCLALSGLLAQTHQRAVIDNTVASVANLPAHKIAPSDLIAISVYDAPELTRTIRVGPDGKIALPMVKDRIPAAGLLPSELETAVVNALVKDQILVSPVVTVTVLEYNDRTVSVLGAVKRPLTFAVTSRVTLLDALARAEGLTSDAGPDLRITFRSTGPDGKPAFDTRTVPVRSLIDNADPALNFELTGGEEVRVPEALRVYVVGNVKKPGAFPLRDADGFTVLKILALSEGVTSFATNQAYIYRKDHTTGSRTEIAIDLDKIIHRQQADVPLQPEDVFYIPESKGRKNMATVLEKAAGFATASAAGMFYLLR